MLQWTGCSHHQGTEAKQMATKREKQQQLPYDPTHCLQNLTRSELAELAEILRDTPQYSEMSEQEITANIERALAARAGLTPDKAKGPRRSN